MTTARYPLAAAARVAGVTKKRLYGDIAAGRVETDFVQDLSLAEDFLVGETGGK